MKVQLFTGAACAALLSSVAPAYAQTAAAGPVSAAAEGNAVEGVVVNGKGQTRQIQLITATQVQEAVPGTSPIKVLQALPGVEYTSSDPFGAYEWATRISVRGFNQNQMGFTLDGVPLGDMSYGNDNGLHISRAISSENLGTTQLAEGTGGLGTASTSNLGGTLEFHSRAPSTEFGMLASGTIGSYDTSHEFLRIDTGVLPTGATAYASVSNQFSDKWKGFGEQKDLQVNSKFVQPIGSNVTVTGFFNYSDRAETDYQDLSLGLIKQFGYSLDNIANNFPLALKIANAYKNSTPYPAPFTNTPDAVDAVYFNGSGLRQDFLGGLDLAWDITDDLKLNVNTYSHTNHGVGTWDTPYPTPVPSPTGVPISERTTEYYIQREGVTASLDYHLGSHDIEGGLWYEDNNFNQARRFYSINATGTNINNLEFPTNPFYTQWYGEFVTHTLVFHLQDNWKITDDLRLNYGFKTQSVDITGNQAIPMQLASGKISNDAGFLPQVGLNYSLHQFGEVFADFSENMQAFVGANTNGPFSTTQAGFDAIAGKLKPETSDTSELGYRFNHGPFQASIAGYYVKFYNRLLTVPTGSAIQGDPSVLANVGSVTTKGVELSGAWQFQPHWTLSGSYSYNDSTYDNNVAIAGTGTVYDIAGKTAVDAPKEIANVSLGYDNGSLFGSLDASYMSKRYFTYENDQSVPSYIVTDLNIGYRFKQAGMLKGVEIQANVTNLTGERYISTIGTNGFTFSGDYQTLQAAAPREAFLTLRKQF